MASIIWDRDPQEAMNNPYEYNAQKQFHREAISLTQKLCDRITTKKEFLLDERSLEKAIWMLQTDALFAFQDAIILLELKKHRVVGRLLRDMLESVDLIEYLSSDSDNAKKSLNDWFNDEIIMHKEFRNYIKTKLGENEAKIKKDDHRTLSKFTHRSYMTLLYGYARVIGNVLHYDEKWTLPGTVSMYYALLGIFGKFVIENLKVFGILDKGEIEKAWIESMEDFQIPRGYLSKEDKVFLGIDDE